MCGITLYHNKGSFTLNKELSHRGPDETITTVTSDKEYTFIFHRLSINDLSENGRQPFQHQQLTLMCNGEIYNHKELEKEFNIMPNSKSDCEVILHLYQRIGFIKTIERLDGVFAIALYDESKHCLYLARDPIGVRPLFYNFEVQAFASEAKALPNSPHTRPFPPAKIYSSIFGSFMSYASSCVYQPINTVPLTSENLPRIQLQLRQKFLKAVEKRIKNTERPLGLLLSGGFDSSIVASIAKHLFPNRKFHTFSIGFKDSSDLHYARLMSKFLNSEHHEVRYTIEEALNSIPEVIRKLETFDITTIRASTPMYLLSKYIVEKTDIKVLLSGEGSDEFGAYKYFYNAPSTTQASDESRRLFDDLYLFDVLRADRSTASHGLELRVPFLDLNFFDLMHQIPAEFHRPAPIDDSDQNSEIIEKRHLRDTFRDYLPQEVLWRKKDAFSDSVGESWRNRLIKYSDLLFTDEDFNTLSSKIKHLPPKTKEALWYRTLFDKDYNECAHNLTPYYWMPKWTISNPTDPSAKII